MIELIKSKDNYPKLSSVPIGTIFSWPIDSLKSERAFAIKVKEGILWIHSVGFNSQFYYDNDFKAYNMKVEIEGQIVIKEK